MDSDDDAIFDDVNEVRQGGWAGGNDLTLSPARRLSNSDDSTCSSRPCSRWRLMRTLTALVTEQDSKLLASRQGVVDVEEEEEVTAVVTVARAANTTHHSAALGVAGCMVVVVPITAPTMAVLPLPTKQRGRHLRYYAQEHASRPTAVPVTAKQQPVARPSGTKDASV